MPLIDFSNKARETDSKSDQHDYTELAKGRGRGLSTDEGFRQRLHAAKIDEVDATTSYFLLVDRYGHATMLEQITALTVTTYKYTEFVELADASELDTLWATRASSATYKYIFELTSISN